MRTRPGLECVEHRDMAVDSRRTNPESKSDAWDFPLADNFFFYVMNFSHIRETPPFHPAHEYTGSKHFEDRLLIDFI